MSRQSSRRRSRLPRLDSWTRSVSVLDIGASAVVCLIAVQKTGASSHTREAEVHDETIPLEVKGIGVHASPGMSGGGIDDLDAMEAAVRQAVNKAEEQFGHTIDSIFVNVSAGAFSHERCRLDLPLNGRVVEVNDVVDLFAPLASRPAPRGNVVLKTIPHTYLIDQVRSVKDPRGLHANVLSSEVYRLFCELAPIEDIVLCTHRCHLEVEGVVASGDASARGAMVFEERRHGAVLLDIGAGSTAMSVFRDDELIYLVRLPVAGHHFTRDLAHGLGIDMATAERLKILHGTVTDPGAMAAPISLPNSRSSSGDRHEFTGQQISEILAPRASELLELVDQHIARSDYQSRTPRVVLTGGGAQLGGFREMVVSQFGAQVRLARPLMLEGLPESMRQPHLSVAVGMLMMGLEPDSDYYGASGSALRKGKGLFSSLFS